MRGKPKGRITVFGSGQIQRDSADYLQALELGRAIARAGYGHVSGGYGGTMEAGARGAREEGAETTGVTIQSWGPPNAWISRKIETPNLFERIRCLMEEGDAYVVLPGATGTLIELAMAWERAHKGLERQKSILLLGEFWEPVIQLVSPYLPTPKNGKGTPWIHGDLIARLDTPADIEGFLTNYRKTELSEESH